MNKSFFWITGGDKLKGIDPKTFFITLAKKMHQGIYDATTEALLFVWGEIPSYPVAAKKAFPFKSFRQFLFVKRSIEDGTMEVPYKRTGTLGRSLTKEVRSLGGEVGHEEIVGVIGTNIVYAPWVISSDEIIGMNSGPQAQYHTGVWYTLQDVLLKCKDKIKEIFADKIDKVIGA